MILLDTSGLLAALDEGQRYHEVCARLLAEGTYERLPQLAAELINLKVDVMVTAGTPSTLAAKNATSTIPIVMRGGDAVASGLVASLARADRVIE